MFRSILVAVDSSHAARNAVRRAGRIAVHFQARLTLLQCVGAYRAEAAVRIVCSYGQDRLPGHSDSARTVRTSINCVTPWAESRAVHFCQIPA
jgi:nucleotide-binding universal stress UspA family protein